MSTLENEKGELIDNRLITVPSKDRILMYYKKGNSIHLSVGTIRVNSAMFSSERNVMHSEVIKLKKNEMTKKIIEAKIDEALLAVLL
jgi:hypothetical protein